MRLHFNARSEADPPRQLVDGFIFLSGGIFDLIERLAASAETHGFAGKVRLDVIARDLLDRTLQPLVSEYEPADLERAVDVLMAAIERIGREFYSDQYEAQSRSAM